MLTGRPDQQITMPCCQSWMPAEACDCRCLHAGFMTLLLHGPKGGLMAKRSSLKSSYQNALTCRAQLLWPAAALLPVVGSVCVNHVMCTAETFNGRDCRGPGATLRSHRIGAS